MSDMLSALKESGLITEKTEKWGRRQELQRGIVRDRLINSGTDPEAAKQLARNINDAEIKRRETIKRSKHKRKSSRTGNKHKSKGNKSA